jgi:hypothetical protein
LAFHLSLGSSQQVFGRLYFLKKQPGHAEFISASHQDGYPIYRQFIAKHIFYFASEMPICIGMTLILFLPNTCGLQPSGGLKCLLLGWSKRLAALLDKPFYLMR